MGYHFTFNILTNNSQSNLSCPLHVCQHSVLSLLWPRPPRQVCPTPLSGSLCTSPGVMCPVLPKQPVEESLFLSFTPFLPVYFPFSPVSFGRSFCSPDNSLLLGMWLTNISSLSVTGLSIHLPRSFAEQKVLTSDEEQVITFSLLCMFLVSNPRILPRLALDSKDLPLFFFLKVSQS